MAGDRWEEGGKEKISRVVINSRSDLCGKILQGMREEKKVRESETNSGHIYKKY